MLEIDSGVEILIWKYGEKFSASSSNSESTTVVEGMSRWAGVSPVHERERTQTKAKAHKCWLSVFERSHYPKTVGRLA